MNSKKTLSLAHISLALVYDEPNSLPRSVEHPFPQDAEAEWETAQTIEKIAESWSRLGCTVVKIGLNRSFLKRWSECYQEINLVHSVVEGWGTPSREAWLPSLCEMSGVPFIGSDPFAQCVAMRKSAFKILCRDAGVPTPNFHRILVEEDILSIPEALLNRPHFIKPDCEGSGMGIEASHSLSHSPAQTRATCRELLKRFPEGVLIEDYLPGRELTSAFLGTDPATTLPIAEIEVPDGVYGLSNKSKESMDEKVSFPKLTDLQSSTITGAMETLRKHIGFDDFVRFDWKLTENGMPMLLEANPLAGLSYYYSVLPKMAAAAGMTYEDLLEKIALSALARRKHRRFWYGRARLHAMPASP